MEDGSRSAGHYHRHRSGGGGGGGGGGEVAAPFVLKTYRIVDDPSTDGVISWGRNNNSFVVVDPFAFSQTILPSNFKHGNFSSFVRQLNTYGFRKVDPDRWEFAHSSFLRGQTNLLRQIVRRNSGGGKKKEEEGEEEAEEDEMKVAAEVVRLKQEQRRIEERVQGMWRRVQETERRPRQMLAFLVKVAGDPKLLGRLAGQSEAIEGGEKRARLRAGGDVDGSWTQLKGEEGVVCGGDSGGGGGGGGYDFGGEFWGGTIDPVGVYGGGAAGWMGSEYGGGVGVDVGGGGGPTAFPFSHHMENGFYYYN